MGHQTFRQRRKNHFGDTHVMTLENERHAVLKSQAEFRLREELNVDWGE